MWDVLIEFPQIFEESALLPSETLALYLWLCLSLALNAAMLLCWVLGVLRRLMQRVRRLFKVQRREIVVQVQRAPARAKEVEKPPKTQPELKEIAVSQTMQEAHDTINVSPADHQKVRASEKKIKQQFAIPAMFKRKKRKTARGRTPMYTPCFFAQMPIVKSEEEML